MTNNRNSFRSTSQADILDSVKSFLYFFGNFDIMRKKEQEIGMSYRMWRKSQPFVLTEGKRGFFDLSYGAKSEKQKLDIWLPEKGDGPFPVIISIHGGGYLALMGSLCEKEEYFDI